MLQPTDKFASPDRNAAPAPYNPPKPLANTAEQATIGRSIVIKGEITGAETLYIDGRVEGSIKLPENRVTVGRNGVVLASVAAREVVVIDRQCASQSSSMYSPNSPEVTIHVLPCRLKVAVVAASGSCLAVARFQISSIVQRGGATPRPSQVSVEPKPIVPLPFASSIVMMQDCLASAVRCEKKS